MTSTPKSGKSWLAILLIIAAVAIWGYGQLYPAEAKGRRDRPAAREKSSSRNSPPSSAPRSLGNVEKIGGYEVYRNCTLAEARNNDGDSFMVTLPNGKREELRLYFVDTPESAFKSYAGGQNNHKRIAEQAADMGGIEPEQAVEIGKKAKQFTLSLLGKQPFSIYTKWDSPFNDNRFHAFIEVSQDGKTRWLEELLVERGFVRIHTKPADLPDGTPASKQKARLKELERAAKKAEAGVWGL
jgi:endonuclease YncB( thermonuclease family)